MEAILVSAEAEPEATWFSIHFISYSYMNVYIVYSRKTVVKNVRTSQECLQAEEVDLCNHNRQEETPLAVFAPHFSRFFDASAASLLLVSFISFPRQPPCYRFW